MTLNNVTAQQQPQPQQQNNHNCSWVDERNGIWDPIPSIENKNLK